MEGTPEIRVGTAGWSYKDWEGIFYPPGMHHRKQHPLEFLARCFDMVEINTSFYGHIKPHLAKLWARKATEVNPRFVFTAKLHRSFTHSPLAVMEPTSAATIQPNDEDEALAREGLEALAAEGKLGALLIQFPVSYKNTSLNREYLDGLLRQFIEYPRVVEVRHASWDNPETLSYFSQKNVAFCNIDQPLMGRSLEPTEHVTSPAAMSGCTDEIMISGLKPRRARIATTTSIATRSWPGGKTKSSASPTRPRSPTWWPTIIFKLKPESTRCNSNTCSPDNA